MMTKERKAAIIAEYGRSEGDTGSPEVQVQSISKQIQRIIIPEEVF